VTPAKAVGGDLYDFHIQNGKLYFCIGDVAGKGVPASLVMSMVISTFHTLSVFEDNPAHIISSMNSSLSERNESMIFVTIFVGILHLSTGELLFSNAGHNAPMIISGGKAEMLKVDPNVPMCIVPDWNYSMQKMTLTPDMMLFLYTDGLTEATRNDGKMFEEERVLEHLSGLDDDISAQDIISQMLKAVNLFVGDAEQSDDLTMLTLRLTKEYKSKYN
jgi:sigma-B regulation protein RsbU (phosphoserine phosphatase)